MSTAIETDKVKQLITIDDEIATLETEIAALKKARKGIEEELLEEFAVNGMQNMNIDGRTVYSSTTTRASIDAARKEEAYEILDQLGYGEIIKPGVNANTLSAMVREWLDPECGTGIPQELEPCLKIYEQRRIGVRKS